MGVYTGWFEIIVGVFMANNFQTLRATKGADIEVI
jgi:hypothetical protein